MSLVQALRDPSADRFVLLGALAVRPVPYGGTTPTGPYPTPTEPLAGLQWREPRSRQVALFHPTTHCYGFLDLPPGPCRLLVEDPHGRFLPRAVEATAPDRRALGEALARGVAEPPPGPPPLFLTVPMRPAPGSPLRGAETALHGVVRDAAGRPLPFAWVRVTTAQGTYVTYTDGRGQYLAPLAFLRPQLPADDDDAPVVLVPATVRVHALLAPLPAAPLDVFPAGFDALVPGTPDFEAVYSTSATVEVSHNVKVGTQPRLDLQP